MSVENKRMQQRYGSYSAFQTDKQNLIPNEFASVTSGDPDTIDGKALYFAFSPGDTKRISTAEEVNSIIGEVEEAVKNAGIYAESAQSAKDTAVQSATQAKQYYENTKQLSISNVGDVQISIDAERRCLVAQYMQSEEEELPDDWYTEFLAQISAWLEQANGSALAAKNSENAAKSYKENAADSKSAAVAANQSAQQAKTECISASGTAQTAANSAKTYYEQTKALSISSVGNVTFAIDVERNCLTATYNENQEVE